MEQQRLIPESPLEHRAIRRSRHERTEFPNAERIFEAKWRKENANNQILHRILAPDGQEFAKVSRRDAAVAATVVCWMGTNVGRGFMHSCEEQWKKHLDEYHKPPKERTEYKLWQRMKLFELTPLQRAKAQLDKVRERLRQATS